MAKEKEWRGGPVGEPHKGSKPDGWHVPREHPESPNDGRSTRDRSSITYGRIRGTGRTGNR